MYKEVRAKLNK